MGAIYIFYLMLMSHLYLANTVIEDVRGLNRAFHRNQLFMYCGSWVAAEFNLKMALKIKQRDSAALLQLPQEFQDSLWLSQCHSYFAYKMHFQSFSFFKNREYPNWVLARE